MRQRIPCFIALLVLSAACGSEADLGVRTGEDAQPLDGRAILSFLNGSATTAILLVDDVHVQAAAARNIVAHVRGADGVWGTSDDDRLDTLDELDAVPRVGPATIAAIDTYVRALGDQRDVVIEGVALTMGEVEAMLRLANDASFDTLDLDVGLDARAARAVVAARPIASIQILAGLSYVNASALTKMRDWVHTHPSLPPEPPVDQTPAVIVSAATPDSTHVVVTFSKPLDPATPGDAFLIFISEPDAGILSRGATIAGAVVTVEMEEQEPGMDYTFEAEATVRDVGGIPVDQQAGRWIHFDGFQGGTPPPPGEVDCTVLSGGTFDGTSYTAAEECTAVRFLNLARFSEMEQLSVTGRRVAYDCGPSGSCGFRSSSWQRLAQFADFSDIGATALSGLKADSVGWSPSGLRYDTVAAVWGARASLIDHQLSFDAVTITRRRPDEPGTNIVYRCAEIRDSEGAPNFLTACFTDVAGITACGSVNECLDAAVGTRVSIRGTFRVSNQSPGGYRVSLSRLPSAANPAVP